MLAYFGEIHAMDCGKCDVCRNKKKTVKESDKKYNLAESIVSYLQNHPEGARFITLESQFNSDKKSLSQILSYLCNEGYLKLRDNLYHIN